MYVFFFEHPTWVASWLTLFFFLDLAGYQIAPDPTYGIPR